MTNKELQEKLKQYPDNMEIFLSDRVTDFDYGLLEFVEKKTINFSEEPGGKVLSTDEVIVLGE